MKSQREEDCENIENFYEAARTYAQAFFLSLPPLPPPLSLSLGKQRQTHAPLKSHSAREREGEGDRESTRKEKTMKSAPSKYKEAKAPPRRERERERELFRMLHYRANAPRPRRRDAFSMTLKSPCNLFETGIPIILIAFSAGTTLDDTSTFHSFALLHKVLFCLNILIYIFGRAKKKKTNSMHRPHYLECMTVSTQHHDIPFIYLFTFIRIND